MPPPQSSHQGGNQSSTRPSSAARCPSTRHRSRRRNPTSPSKYSLPPLNQHPLRLIPDLIHQPKDPANPGLMPALLLPLRSRPTSMPAPSQVGRTFDLPTSSSSSSSYPGQP